MVRYPYTIEMWCEGNATLNPDGSFDESQGRWRTIGRCNARQNGQARQVRGANGDAYFYAYEVVMPSSTLPIPIGTKVRIFDRRGINIFDRSVRTNDCPMEKGTANYSVQGFYKSGQRNEDTRLWL